jgi:hypothetical protein
MSETWRPIEGFAGLYDVSDAGRVVSLAFRNGRVARRERRLVLRPTRNPSGYLMVSLCRGGVVHTRAIHRLVAAAFLEARPSPAHQIAHLNGDAADARACNLAWVTASENERHKIGHGTQVHGERSYLAKLTESDVVAMREARAAGASLRELMVRFGMSRGGVADICRGRCWTHAGGPIMPPGVYTSRAPRRGRITRWEAV